MISLCLPNFISIYNQIVKKKKKTIIFFIELEYKTPYEKERELYQLNFI